MRLLLVTVTDQSFDPLSSAIVFAVNVLSTSTAPVKDAPVRAAKPDPAVTPASNADPVYTFSVLDVVL